MDVAFIKKKVKFLYARQGILGPVKALGRKTYWYALRVPANYAMFLWANTIMPGRPREFSFQGNEYKYLYKTQNFVWRTERIAEVPIVLPYFQEAYDNNKKVLEIGDTIGQYSEFNSHDVVDKYEFRDDLINIDIVDFKPKEKYDLIVSISTMEHVGWDWPDERDPEKIPHSLRLMKEWLAPGGTVVITMPIGLNPFVDEHLKNNSMPFTQEFYLKRLSKANQWEETTKQDALTKKFNTPFENANAIVIGLITKDVAKK